MNKSKLESCITCKIKEFSSPNNESFELAPDACCQLEMPANLCQNTLNYYTQRANPLGFRLSLTILIKVIVVEQRKS